MNQVQANLFKLVQHIYGYAPAVLKDVVRIHNGARIVKADLPEDGKYPVYAGSTKPLGYHNVFNTPADTAFIIMKGCAGDAGYSAEPFFAGDGCLWFEHSEQLLPKYLYYSLTIRHNALMAHVRQSGVTTLPKIAVENLQITVPDIPEQTRLVRFLDLYEEAAVLDGMPREISLHWKRYEYYRDTLLNYAARGRQ